MSDSTFGGGQDEPLGLVRSAIHRNRLAEAPIRNSTVFGFICVHPRPSVAVTFWSRAITCLGD